MSIQCVKVEHLRQAHGDMDFKRWVTNPDNIYVGGKGRVYIHHYPRDGEERQPISSFVFPASKWANPFTEEYAPVDVIILYRRHILSSQLRNELHELEGKTLGCFCPPDAEVCHARALLYLVQNREARVEISQDFQAPERSFL